MPSVGSHLPKAKNGGTWKGWTNFWGKHNGTWKKPLSVHVKSAGSWVKVWDERPQLTITNNTYFYAFDPDRTLCTTFFTVYANGFNATITATANTGYGGEIASGPGGPVSADGTLSSQVSAYYPYIYGDNSILYPTITVTNASGSVTKQYGN